jgi:hypothetical protein
MPTFTITADTSLVTKPKYLRSWHFAETAAAPAQILLRDGGASGPVMARINLAASTSASEAYYKPGLLFPLGLYVDVLAGAVTGSVDLH